MEVTKGNIKRIILFGLLIGFFILGFLELQRAVPEPKEKRIYSELRPYMPYLLEKKIGGLQIVNKQNSKKESPSASEVMHRLDELEKAWGKQHLKIVGNQLIITDENNTTIATLHIQTEQELQFLKRFFGI